MSVPHTTSKRRTYPLPIRIVGIVVALAGIVAGTALVILAAYQHFAISSNFHPDYRVDHVYESAFHEPLVIHEAGEYGVTSMEGPLEGCTLTADNGTVIRPVLDESITKRPSFRFTSPARTYTIECTPSDLWFQVFRGDDLKRAAQGYDSPLHPSLYYIIGGVASWVVGMFFWNRFVMRPRDWSNT